MRRPNPKNLALAGLGMAVVAALGWLCFYYSFGAPLARMSYDLPFAFRSNIATPEICLVVIDEKSARALNQPVSLPWDRSLHAKLVKALTDAGAKAILFDLVFDSPSADPKVDEEFASAIQASGRVFLGAALLSSPGRDVDEEQLLAPIPLLRHAAVGWGLLVFKPIDPDSGVRHIYTGSDQVPTITWKMARYLGAQLPETPDPKQDRWLNYYAPAGMMASVDYNEALNQTELPPNFFRDRIVVIGGKHTVGSLTEQRDEFLNPYTHWGQPFVAGMEIHAMTLLNLLHGDWLTRLEPGTESCLIILGGLLISGILSFVCEFGPFRASGMAVAISLAIGAGACWLVWSHNVWFDWLVPAAVQTPVALFWAVGMNYLLETKKRMAIQRAFSLYLSPHMADEIAESRFDLKPGGKLVEATMMFTDLQGFTKLSEQINDPAEISQVLTTYFNNTTEHVLNNKGTISKYIGDAVYAIWGAPLKDDDHAYNAVLAAWSMHQFSQLNVHGHRLITRIGVNSGKVLAGNLGSEMRFDYTAIGDPVNLASRLEGLNKYMGTQILLSSHTWERLNGRFAGRPLGHFIVMGKSEPITIYELLGPKVTNVVQAQIESFTEALSCFQAGDMAKARAGIERTLDKLGGKDGPCEFYLNEIARLEKNGVPKDWTGVIVLEGK